MLKKKIINDEKKIRMSANFIPDESNDSVKKP